METYREFTTLRGRTVCHNSLAGVPVAGVAVLRLYLLSEWWLKVCAARTGSRCAQGVLASHWLERVLNSTAVHPASAAQRA